jgi:hypothetical protein
MIVSEASGLQASRGRFREGLLSAVRYIRGTLRPTNETSATIILLASDTTPLVGGKDR